MFARYTQQAKPQLVEDSRYYCSSLSYQHLEALASIAVKSQQRRGRNVVNLVCTVEIRSSYEIVSNHSVADSGSGP